jgi:hypothetical protein
MNITRKQVISIILSPNEKLAIVTLHKKPLVQEGANSVAGKCLLTFEEFLTEKELAESFEFYNEWFELPEDIDFVNTIKQLSTINIPEYENTYYIEPLKRKAIKNVLTSILDYITALIKQKYEYKAYMTTAGSN